MNFTVSQTENQKPVVLAIGGLDPSGGAGIALDARAIQMTGCHPATVATLLTNQTGKQFVDATPVPGDAVEATCRLLLEDLHVRAIKVGAIGTLDTMRAVERVARSTEISTVLDPVFESTTGGRLLDPKAIEYLKFNFDKHNLIVTPNRREAEILSDIPLETEADMAVAAKRILAMGFKAVLIKGGHLPGTRCIDFLCDHNGSIAFGSPRLGESEVRGTGCALASFIAGGLAHGHPLSRAVSMARNMIRFAIKLKTQIGRGIYVLDLT